MFCTKCGTKNNDGAKFCIKKFENSQKAKNLIPQQIFSFV